MSMNPGDHLSYRLMPEPRRFTGTVLAVDERSLSLRLDADRPEGIAAGRYLMITEPDTDTEHYNEVTAFTGATVHLRRMWTGKRGFFRIDDYVPVLHRKIDRNAPRPASRIFTGYGAPAEDLETPDESVSPRVWKMLVDLNTKFTMLLDRLNLEGEGLFRAESVPVNISASGIRLVLPEQTGIDDLFELKILLPDYPPIGILVHGTVVRVDPLEQGCSASLCFTDLTNEVTDAIIQYTLKRQRDLLNRDRRLDRGE